MPKIDFTADELKQYFTQKREHYYAELSREKETQMRVHADGVFPEELINERRPNENEDVFAYRKKIFVPKTKPYFNKIESTLQKIRRSSDWSIKYGDGSFDRIVDGEKLSDYAEYNYPVFSSITNWAFSLLLRNYLIDANALLIVAPTSIPEADNIFLEPVVTIFNSCEVIEYVADDFAILINKLGCTYGPAGKEKDGLSFFVITTVAVIRYDQIDGRGNYQEAFYFEHGLNMLPAFKLGGIVVDVYGTNTLYESRISGILPEFNECLREYSDLQIAKVLHLFPTPWEYTNNECTNCKGTGRVMGTLEGVPCEQTCSTCNGQSYVSAGPSGKVLIKPAGAGEQQLPNPVGGFIEKDVEIIKVQDEAVQAHILNGLAAINFEFLATTPLNQSGTAKEVDKDELNNTVHAVAEDMVRIMDKVYYIIALYRYSAQYTPVQIYDMLPKIAVPEKYDILSSSYYIEQMKGAKDNKLNPAIINALEVVYATKAFNNDATVAEHVGLILKLDPLAGIGEDDKMSRLSNNGITQLDYVVSSNINKFVDTAVENIMGFVDMDILKQREEIYKMATEQISSLTADLIPEDANIVQ